MLQQGIECKDCGVRLSDDNWQPCRKAKNVCRCSSCSNARTTAWKKANPDKVKSYKKTWAKNNLDKQRKYKESVTTESQRRYSIKANYGISWEEYLGAYQKSNGDCSICGTPLSLWKKEEGETAHVDHCHKTGIVRGVLCRSCNRGIGYLQDSPALLEKAAAYLKESK